ncbi:MAG TPA: hypothetical protein VN640_00405 [Sphingomicrobium sp.]|nr:hypothetical protein [Sphingomicrobium sp.]
MNFDKVPTAADERAVPPHCSGGNKVDKTELSRSAAPGSASRRHPAGSGSAPQLLINSGDLYRTVTLDWHGGLRYPRLEKAGNGEGTLDALLAPR